MYIVIFTTKSRMEKLVEYKQFRTMIGLTDFIQENKDYIILSISKEL